MTANKVHGMAAERSWIESNDHALPKCESHLYIEFNRHGMKLRYVAPKTPQASSPPLLEKQLAELELACRSAQLVLNDEQKAHQVSLLRECSKAHQRMADVFMSRARDLEALVD